MEHFTWTTNDGGTVSGIQSVPLDPTNSPRFKPLIIALHGGGYGCEYFNGDAKHTATTASQSFGVPFIAIDRPCYENTTSILPIAAGLTFTSETARRLHESIFPYVWSKIGVSNHCTSIVLLCHSLGVMAGVATAALHAQDKMPNYPLGGLICSGLGHRQHPDFSAGNPEHSSVDFATQPVAEKDQFMFHPGTVDPALLTQSERLNQPMPLSEVASLVDEFIPKWRQLWAPHVSVPVLFALAEGDLFFEATKEHAEECLAAFTGSRRVKGGIVPDAPHCMELSYWSAGWYAR